MANYPIYDRQLTMNAISKDMPDYIQAKGGFTFSPPKEIKPVSNIPVQNFPDFFMRKSELRDELEITLIGQLWMRLYNYIMKQRWENQGIYMVNGSDALFNIGKCGIIQVFKAIREGQDVAVVAALVKNQEAVLFYDEFALFPSDGLITQIMMFKD